MKSPQQSTSTPSSRESQHPTSLSSSYPTLSSPPTPPPPPLPVPKFANVWEKQVKIKISFFVVIYGYFYIFSILIFFHLNNLVIVWSVTSYSNLYSRIKSAIYSSANLKICEWRKVIYLYQHWFVKWNCIFASNLPTLKWTQFILLEAAGLWRSVRQDFKSQSIKLCE